MDAIIALSIGTMLVGVRVWAGSALSEFVAGLPADQQAAVRRALSRIDA